MAFGLLSTGFRKKRLEDIKGELEATYQTSFAQSLDLDPQGPLGQIIAIQSEQLAAMWQLLEDVHNAKYPDTAEGVSLDNAVALTGVTRLPATYSTVTGRFMGALGTFIPVGVIVSVAGVSDSKFVTIASGTTTAGINEVQTVTFSAGPTAGTFQLVFDGQATASIAFNASAAAVKSALEVLSNIDSVTVSGNFTSGFVVTFDGPTLLQNNQPLLTAQGSTLVNGVTSVTVTVTETQRGYRPFVDLPCRAQSPGAVVALAGTLSVIETTLFGFESVTNLLDATVGRNRETDADLRFRRLDLLQTPSTPTLDGIRALLLSLSGVTQALVIENDGDVADSAGRPPHSFECFVQGGADQAIRDAVYSAKPQGVATTGTVTGTVIDSQGFVHTVKFSRPVEKLIWVIVTVTRNLDSTEGALYPADGNAQVVAKILEYGATLRIGRDVWVNAMYSYLNQVPGVKGLTVLVGFTNPPTLSANLTIAPTEIAIFDSSRITVNVI